MAVLVLVALVMRRDAAGVVELVVAAGELARVAVWRGCSSRKGNTRLIATNLGERRLLRATGGLAWRGKCGARKNWGLLRYC